MAKKTEKTPLKKGVSQFNLIGKVKLNDNTFNIDSESQKSDWISSTMLLNVDVGNGVVQTKLWGGYGATRDNVIRVHGVKKDEKGKLVSDYENKFDIDWDDRDDEKILETIGDDCFINVGIEKDNKGKTYVKKFLSAYDAVEYLSEHLEDGTIVNISGTMQYQPYEDGVSVTRNIKSIYLSTKTEEDFKAEFRQTILLDSDSIGRFDREKNTYPIDAYVVDYVSKVDDVEVKQNIVFPKTFYFDVLNAEAPEKTKMLLDKFFKPTKKNTILELGVIGTFATGGAIATVTYDDLDDDVKLMVDTEMMTLEQACAKYTNGKKDNRMVIKQFITKNDSEDAEKKHLVIMREDGKYTPDDFVFISQFVDTDDDDEEIVDDDSIDINELMGDSDSNDDDADDFMKALGLA